MLTKRVLTLYWVNLRIVLWLIVVSRDIILISMIYVVVDSNLSDFQTYKRDKIHEEPYLFVSGVMDLRSSLL